MWLYVVVCGCMCLRVGIGTRLSWYALPFNNRVYVPVCMWNMLLSIFKKKLRMKSVQEEEIFIPVFILSYFELLSDASHVPWLN